MPPTYKQNLVPIEIKMIRPTDSWHRVRYKKHPVRCRARLNFGTAQINADSD